MDKFIRKRQRQYKIIKEIVDNLPIKPERYIIIDLDIITTYIPEETLPSEAILIDGILDIIKHISDRFHIIFMAKTYDIDYIKNIRANLESYESTLKYSILFYHLTSNNIFTVRERKELVSKSLCNKYGIALYIGYQIDKLCDDYESSLVINNLFNIY